MPLSATRFSMAILDGTLCGGRAGERFCAAIVALSLWLKDIDNGEYMTGGVVVILGEVIILLPA